MDADVAAANPVNWALSASRGALVADRDWATVVSHGGWLLALAAGVVLRSVRPSARYQKSADDRLTMETGPAGAPRRPPTLLIGPRSDPGSSDRSGEVYPPKKELWQRHREFETVEDPVVQDPSHPDVTVLAGRMSTNCLVRATAVSRLKPEPGTPPRYGAEVLMGDSTGPRADYRALQAAPTPRMSLTSGSVSPVVVGVLGSRPAGTFILRDSAMLPAAHTSEQQGGPRG